MLTFNNSNTAEVSTSLPAFLSMIHLCCLLSSFNLLLSLCLGFSLMQSSLYTFLSFLFPHNCYAEVYFPQQSQHCPPIQGEGPFITFLEALCNFSLNLQSYLCNPLQLHVQVCVQSLQKKKRNTKNSYHIQCFSHSKAQ